MVQALFFWCWWNRDPIGTICSQKRDLKQQFIKFNTVQAGVKNLSFSQLLQCNTEPVLTQKDSARIYSSQTDQDQAQVFFLKSNLWFTGGQASTWNIYLVHFGSFDKSEVITGLPHSPPAHSALPKSCSAQLPELFHYSHPETPPRWR